MKPTLSKTDDMLHQCQKDLISGLHAYCSSSHLNCWRIADWDRTVNTADRPFTQQTASSNNCMSTAQQLDIAVKSSCQHWAKCRHCRGCQSVPTLTEWQCVSTRPAAGQSTVGWVVEREWRHNCSDKLTLTSSRQSRTDTCTSIAQSMTSNG